MTAIRDGAPPLDDAPARPGPRVARAASLVPWLVPIGLLAVWELAADVGWLPRRVLPAPSAVARAALTLARTGELAAHVRESAVRAFSGLAIGGSIGFGLGLLNGVSRRAERWTDTTVQMVRNVPPLALVPLVILWFGIDEAAKVFLIAFGVFFPLYVNTVHGIRAVDTGLVEMARTYGLRGATLYWRVVLPGALPSILVGVRYALGFMWVLLIVAETLSARSGIGYMTMNAREFLQTDVVVLGILLYALLGKLADAVARGLERLCLRWNPAYTGAA